MIAYSRFSLFLVKFFKMDPRNTLILAGKNGTQFFSINRVSKNNLKQKKINFSKQIPRDDILAPTIKLNKSSKFKSVIYINCVFTSVNNNSINFLTCSQATFRAHSQKTTSPILSFAFILYIVMLKTVLNV